MIASKNNIVYTSLVLISVTNLIVMHYIIGRYTEVPYETTSYIDNVLGIVIDILILNFIFLFLFKGNIRLSLLVCNIITAAWSFSNVLYSRFFFQYILISSIGQANNILNTSMLRCIIDGIQWNDLLFAVTIILSFIIFFNTEYKFIGTKKIIRTFVISIITIFILIVMNTVIYSLKTTETRSIGYIKHHLYVHHMDLYRNSANPNWTYFQRGTIRTILHPIIHKLFSTKTLSEEQTKIINEELYNQNKKVTTHLKSDVENVIFIIIESYLSAVSDLYVANREITPNLNALKKDPTVLYNGKVKSNITVGESGDGQFIYMTGLLPLRSEITVGRAKDVTLPGLPKILSKKMNLHTRMLIPTTPFMWEQERMCVQYGIEKLFSSIDFKSGKEDLNDEEIFDYLQSLDKDEPRPFFSLVVLTMSMHQPYTKQIDPTFNIKDPNKSNNYINYLNACHYTDKQIGKYLQSLKECDLYKKSLIIITADHHPNPNSLQMDTISDMIPLYIINGNINGQEWADNCNQLDIYTTVLDLLIKVHLEWRGLGNSLLTQDYKNSVNTSKWDISEWILQSNYLNK
jgi:lipoteichoic acid synthase